MLVGVVGEEGRERLLAADCDCEFLSVFILLNYYYLIYFIIIITLFLIIFIDDMMRTPEGLLLVDIVI